MLDKSTLRFLQQLRKNNNKPWFDKNREAYERAKKDFTFFIQQVIDKHAKTDRDLLNLDARKCLFRINRDIRFSKDKAPYKKNFAASLDRGGKKSGFAGYYFHLEPGGSFLGAGIWQPEPATVKKIRQEIDYSFEEFDGMVSNAKFRKVYPGLYTGEGVQLSKVPREFEKDNPAAEYLKFKSWMVLRDLQDEELLSNTLLQKTLESYTIAHPFINFINRAIG